MATAVRGDDVVLRRDGLGPLRGSVAGIDDAGVSVRSELGAMHLVPWDRVRAVQTEQPLPQLARYEQTAIDLWRARSRVERNDLILAEPLLESLFEQYQGRHHETALVVAEGLLRCRLARGAQAMAVIPALETIRLRRRGVETSSYAMLDPVIDTSMWLCIHLPPYWAEPTHLRRLIADLERYDAQGNAAVREMARLYRVAALHATGAVTKGDRAGDGRISAGSDATDGIAFLQRIVAAMAGSDDTDDSASDQRDAVEALSDSLNNLEGWQEAWARYAIGRAMMRSQDGATQRRGMVHLAHVPARFSRSQPFLAGLAAAELADAVEQKGDRRQAASVRAQIERLYPYHPAFMRDHR